MQLWNIHAPHPDTVLWSVFAIQSKSVTQSNKQHFKNTSLLKKLCSKRFLIERKSRVYSKESLKWHPFFTFHFLRLKLVVEFVIRHGLTLEERCRLEYYIFFSINYSKTSFFMSYLNLTGSLAQAGVLPNQSMERPAILKMLQLIESNLAQACPDPAQTSRCWSQCSMQVVLIGSSKHKCRCGRAKVPEEFYSLHLRCCHMNKYLFPVLGPFRNAYLFKEI